MKLNTSGFILSVFCFPVLEEQLGVKPRQLTFGKRKRKYLIRLLALIDMTVASGQRD